MKHCNAKLSLVAIVIVLIIAGCKKKENLPDHCYNGVKDGDESGIDCGGSCEDSCFVFSGRHVYVCGYKDGVAKYWIDSTTEISLTDTAGEEAQTWDIYVYGNDVYVCGWQKEGGIMVAKYWKNGTEVKLTDGTKNATATNIEIVNGDVYVCGAERGPKWVAKYWKNGIPVPLTDGTNNAFANSIFIDGQNVYVSGSEDNGTYDVGKYWVSGGVTSVTSGNSMGYAYDIEVRNGTVYVAGQDNAGTTLRSRYWVNGSPTDLGNNVLVTSLAVDGSDVYTCGSTYGAGNNAVYFKNSSINNLTTGGSGFATDIAISGNDVYVCGRQGTVIKYWKNGEEIVLNQQSTFGEARSIFVKNF